MDKPCINPKLRSLTCDALAAVTGWQRVLDDGDEGVEGEVVHGGEHGTALTQLIQARRCHRHRPKRTTRFMAFLGLYMVISWWFHARFKVFTWPFHGHFKVFTCWFHGHFILLGISRSIHGQFMSMSRSFHGLFMIISRRFVALLHKESHASLPVPCPSSMPHIPVSGAFVLQYGAQVVGFLHDGFAAADVPLTGSQSSRQRLLFQ
jgi:hypothetical protein